MFATFVDRPILAGVISVIITTIGIVAGLTLPVAQYPEIAPPVVNIQATYPGASAQQAYESIAIPLEQEINGAPNLIYIQSTSSADGSVSVDATFEVGSNLDAAAAEVLTRSSRAEAKLPQAVRDQGLEIQKSSRQRLGNVVLYADEGTGFDELFLANYAETQVIKPLRRVTGMGRILNFSNMRYAMRVWLDPAKMEALGMATETVLQAIQAQNAQVTTGSLGKLPMDRATPFELQLVTKGRLVKPEEFANIVLRANADGSVVRVADVGRVELGSEQYGVTSNFDGKPSATLGIFQNPDANAVEVMNGTRETMADLAKRFPPGLHYSIALDSTEFVKEAIYEVVRTLVEAILIVTVVTYLFLQNWRATLIPTIAVPVALIGTFGPMALLGFSFNTLSLLGLVLAVGLVVDDAIIVVENTERLMAEGQEPKPAAREAVNEVGGPVIATTLVLAALFVPVAFIPGLTGQLYNQFALTIAISVLISAVVSLTLTPALCGLLLRPHEPGHRRPWWQRPLDWFNTALERAAGFVVAAIGFLSRHVVLTLAVFALFAGATVLLLMQRPTAFVPEEDQGYLYAEVAMPLGASVQRTEAMNARFGEVLRARDDVDHTIGVSGRSFLADTVAPFYGFNIPVMKPWDERKTTVNDLIRDMEERFKHDPDGQVRIANPSPLPGLGSRGGLTLEIQDRSGNGGLGLAKTAAEFIEKIKALPGVSGATSTTEWGVPQIRLDIDRAKAEQLGVPLSRLFEALGTYVGSSFVNLFNRFGFVYQVYVQSEASGRRLYQDLEALTVLNAEGQPVRLGSLVQAKFTTGPTAVLSYNTYPAIEVAITVEADSSSGTILEEVERLSSELPRNFSIEWTEVAYQEKIAGSFAPLIFGLGVFMIFCFLAGQYESVRLPLVILLATPLAIFGAVGFLALRDMPLDVFGQIGLLLLVGLAAKNSILLVSFAEELRAKGEDALEAAKHATRMRMRPILMTSFAFILGAVPLAIASGAGANARLSMGTVVIGGLVVATILTLFVTPVFYIAAERLRGDTKGKAESGEERAVPAQ
ncbi:MAG: efflux RND transporter permease subunit [Methylorubrum rhodinum]|uniref:efflux RND transporter permease subunit n=1 Tax=Methylorubrum rhodinum TaxID=29428 RepID=UPI003BB20EEE